MRVNAQRGGRPVEYRWRPLFDAAKFGWRPLLECRAVTLPRHENCWNWQPQTRQQISAISRPQFTVLWGHVEDILPSTYPDNMVNFGLLTAEICWRVWGTPTNFNGFRVMAALLHGTLVVGVSQILRRWTEGATYIRQGGHHVRHWPTFLVNSCFSVRVGAYWTVGYCHQITTEAHGC